MKIFNDKELLQVAGEYLEAGLSVFPVQNNKKPAIATWTPYQRKRPTADDLEQMFNGKQKLKNVTISGIAVVCGSVSDGLECLDFDDKGSAFEEWKKKIPLALYSRLTVEQSPSGGYHVYYRCSTIAKKHVAFHRYDGAKEITLIEIRTNGCFTVCVPSKGYTFIQGNLCTSPTITSEEREALVDAAKSFDEKKPEPEKPIQQKPKQPRREYNGESPAEAYNHSDALFDLLRDEGWTYDHTSADGNEHWTRPGKDSGTSATIKRLDGQVPILKNFSTNAGLETDKGYSPFQLYAEIQHGGNQSEAARELLRQGFGGVQRQDAEDNRSAESGDSSGVMTVELDRPVETWTPPPLECFSPRIRRYIESVSSAIAVNCATVAQSLLTIAGAAVGARVKVKLPGINYYAAPILWTAIVASSGIGKTPIIRNSGLNFLEGKQKEYTERYYYELKQYKDQCRRRSIVVAKVHELEKLLVEAELDGVDEIILPSKKGRKSETISVEEAKRRLEKYMDSDLYKIEPQKPVERVIEFSGTFTVEGLLDKASQNPSGFILRQEELTEVFRCLDNDTKVGASGLLLCGWDGAPMRTALKTEELNRTVAECWFSFLGAIVPGNVKRYIVNSERREDGFLSRFFLIFPLTMTMEEYDNRTPFDTDSSVYQDMKKIFESLADLNIELDEPNAQNEARGCDVHKRIIINLSPEAEEAFIKADSELQRRLLERYTNEERSLFSKAKSNLGRLTVVFHLIESVEHLRLDSDAHAPAGLIIYLQMTPVSLDTFKRALKWLNWCVNEANEIYKLLGVVANNDLLARIVDVVRKSGEPMTSNDIGQKISQLKGRDNKPERERLLDLAVKKKLLIAEERKEANNKIVIYYSLP